MYNTRYTLCGEAETDTDSLGNKYPDIMTYPIESFYYENPPIPYALTKNDIDRFDLFIAKWYGNLSYQDILLWLNDIQYISRKNPGDTFNMPLKSDIDDFYIDNRA